jgi:hypothetical protein
MQTPALFQPMGLGAGFGEVYDFSALDAGAGVYNSALDAGADVYPNVAIVDQAGNVSDQNGNVIVSADAITRAAMTPGADVNQAVAREIQTNSPDYAKQFKTAGELARAAADIFNVAKAVIQGKPIPPSPYVYNPNNPIGYNPNVYRPTTATTQLSPNTTNMLLIGGVALVAFLALRRKK